MKHRDRRTLVGLLLACLQFAACTHASQAATEEEPVSAKVEHLEGEEPARVTLTEEAAKRLDVQTATVRLMVVDGALREVIPYAAVLYDPEGETWTYAKPEPLTFVRTPIEIDYIKGDWAVLSAGPPPGTAVVTVGAQELFGSELEFEEE